jgi:M6 family metalloprotease-like protein
VLLVAFSDRPAISEPGEWSSKFFSNTGSVKSYYKEVSYGLLNLAPASENSGVADDGVVGWITLPYGHPNGDKTREIAAIRDAIAAAARNVRFASFDTNGDGFLSSDEIHTVIIFSGFNGSYNTSTPTVWPYQAAYTAGIPVGGKQIGSAAGKGGIVIMAELDGQHTATIGTPVHEIGHDFGLPELYDPDRSTFGVGKWSVMGSGSWNTGGLYPGDTPAHFDAWSKWYLGWVKPTMVTSDAASLSIEQVETSGKIYQLRHNPGGVDWGRHPGNGEYFLIENRQKVGFDAGLPGSGLLIWHINENAPTDRALAEANDQNRLIELEQADGRNNLNRDNSGDAGDPYPGTADSRSLGPSTNPSSMLRSGRSSGVTITNISGSGKIMTLYVGASGRDR